MKDIKPNYYRRNINGVEIDVNDIADAFDLGYHAQNAIKYLVRAGRKDETTLVDDLIKARHYIDRLIKKHAVAEANAKEIAEQLTMWTCDKPGEWTKVEVGSEGEAMRSMVSRAIAKDKATEYIADLGELKNETNPETVIRDDNDGVVAINKPATPITATAWPCWVFRRLAAREYNIVGPYPTREAARRALDPGRTDERVVMADDPYLVEADVVERLFA